MTPWTTPGHSAVPIWPVVSAVLEDGTSASGVGHWHWPFTKVPVTYVAPWENELPTLALGIVMLLSKSESENNLQQSSVHNMIF